MMDVNFFGPVRVTEALLPLLREDGGVDRERGQRGGASRAAALRRVLGEQGGADRLERRAARRGGEERRARGHGAAAS